MAPDNLPIVVDLDGTLILEEISYQSFWLFLKRYWWKAPLLLLWIIRGVAYTKRQLARHITIDPATLPYNQQVLEFMRVRQGQMMILATGADETYAKQVAQYLGLFSHVIASNGIDNTISSVKARRLDEYLQGAPYIYLGNSSQDINVWKHAAYAIAVNTPENVVEELKTLGVPYEIWPIIK